MNTTKKLLVAALSIGVIAFLSSCQSIPGNATAVQNFKAEKYMGTWYEIARIDFKHERNMDNVSAQYSLQPSGMVKVLNSGFDHQKNEWKKAEGKAKFRGEKHIAELKVSFFGPFYSGYNVIALDEDYRYALVAGKDLDYLWILSRSTTIPEAVKTNYLKIAQDAGYDTSRLTWVTHDRDDNPYLNK